MSGITTVLIEPIDTDDPRRLLIDCPRARWNVDEARWVLVDLGDWRGRQARIILDMPSGDMPSGDWAPAPEIIARALIVHSIVTGSYTVIALDEEGREVAL